MDLDKIRELLKIVAESEVAEVEFEVDDMKLVVRKSGATVMVQQPMMPYMMPPMGGYGAPPAGAPAYGYPPQHAVPQNAAPAGDPGTSAPAGTSPAEEPLGGETVTAPIVGTYYSAPSPDSDPFIKVGSRVEIGDVLCIIEAMKLMNEIKSDVAGTVKQMLVSNAEPVEYDQPLFVIG
ncbi:acetyl-CoA carboxylase biotin carboxyl carrier protein [soil metagenome]